nr:uncharacterized protein LOC106691321 [Halyomorpha halys]
MLRLLCFLCFAGVALGQTTDLNELLDQVLEVLRPKIVDEGKDQIPINNINYNWSYKVLFIPIYGSVTCYNGKVRYLSTVKRTGDASGEIVEKGLSLQASVGLDIMQFLFQSCSLDIKSLISLKEALAGNVDKNSLTLQVYIEGNVARIDKIWVSELSSIELTTGTNILHKLESAILNELIDKFHGVILNSINNQLRQFEGKSFKIPLFKIKNHNLKDVLRV